MSALAMAKVLGDDMDRHPPVRVDDVACDWTARPADEERLAQTLALASEHGLVLIPFAGGTHAMLGNPPSRADVRLDLGALRGVLELDRSEGVCHVRGATPLSALREALVGTGWEVPLDVPDASTVGGALACNAVGPARRGRAWCATWCSAFPSRTPAASAPGVGAA